MRELLKKRFYLDGATGSELVKRGLPTKGSEKYSIEKVDVMRSIIEGYLKVGSNAILSNTFNCNRFKADKKYSLSDYIGASYNLAKEVVEKYNAKLLYDCGPSGEMMYPYGKMTFDEAYEVFSEQAKIVSQYNYDGAFLETFTDLQELRAAVIAFKENTDLPIFASMSFEKGGRTYTGVSVESFVLTMQSLGVTAVGINCGTGADIACDNVKRMIKVASLPIFVKPNAGMPKLINGVTRYDATAKEFAHFMKEIALLGVGILGGCCGTDSQYIEETIKLTKDLPIKTFDSNFDGVCSYSNIVEFGKKTLVIGARVNPTNKPLLKKAIVEDDYDYILSMCVEQVELGADLLDVNVGMPNINEKEKLTKTITAVQSVAGAPLVIDTSDKNALNSAVRNYSGVAIINSVSGEESSMNNVFPLAKLYSSYVVALCLDEKGIPTTVEGRIDVAKKIINKAKEYGIDKSKLIFDPLTMAVSVNENNALITLECVRILSEELGVKTVLGISNVSFGLPNRMKINSTFFSKAIEKGLSLAIVNPIVKPISDKLADNLLNGLDKGATNYITANQGTTVVKEEVKDKDIIYCIKKGLIEDGMTALKMLVNSENYSNVIDDFIIKGLNELGSEYEQGRAYLPQLISGSEVAKKMLDFIKVEFIKDNESAYKASVILATVKGDVHDIGKNIVKAVVSNYGYRCIDLGRDVSKEEVLDAIAKYKPEVVGLSALMTTTLGSMTETIKAIKEYDKSIVIIVGGAVVTADYALTNGVIYARDAQSTAKKLEQIFNNR